eukprot:790635-Ditylum_brightwellii.AAC.1
MADEHNDNGGNDTSLQSDEKLLNEEESPSPPIPPSIEDMTKIKTTDIHFDGGTNGHIFNKLDYFTFFNQ